ncbi:MAG TPA: PIN domain-containing protein [Gemmata sp.]|jgi:hypothetical protein|nr:PIN domain-containing protein [Gemmata sp.]
MSVNTTSGRLAKMVFDIKGSLYTLLDVHSTIHHEPTRRVGGHRERTPWGLEEVGGGIIVGYSIWNPLSPEGTRAQSAALTRYQKFAAVTRLLLAGQPEKVLDEFAENDRDIIAAIQQTSSPQGTSPKDILAKINHSLDSQLTQITNLYDGLAGDVVVVPDTNALLFNPNLEDWVFDGISRFTVVLLPTLLKELDAIKVNYRNEDVRKKAEGLITRIKGYRSRGQLNEGVPLRKGISTLLGWAIEPNMRETLPWFDTANDDDRLLASFMEVMRRFPHSAAILITRDINLQNKAEFAQLCFGEPPDVP